MPEEASGDARSSVWVREEGRGAACGVQGCLFGSVALFAILLVVMLIIVVMRFGTPF